MAGWVRCKRAAARRGEVAVGSAMVAAAAVGVRGLVLAVVLVLLVGAWALRAPL